MQQAGSVGRVFYLQTQAYLCRMQHDLAFGLFSARYIVLFAERKMKHVAQIAKCVLVIK